MRVVSLLLCVLLACCMAFAMAQGDAAPATPAAVVPEQQQQQQAAQVPTPAEPVAAVQQQEAPAAAAPVVPETPATPTPAAPVATPAAAATPAAPASSDSAAVEAVQRSVSELASQSRSTSEKVDKLSQIVSEGFTKLHAADAAQSAAAGSAKSASADATASALKDSSARVGQLEKEVKELKSILQNFVAEQGKLNAAAAAEAKKSAAKPAAGADQSAILSDIRSSQKEILSLLNTTAWNFDHEALLETAKTRGLEASSALGRLVGQAVEQAQTHYPTLQQSAIELGTSLGSQGMEHAEVLRGHAEQGATVAHSALSQLLKEQGVPAEYIKPAVLSLLSIAVLVNAIIIFSLLKCLCRACCCCNCGNKKPRAAHAAGAAAGGAASAYKKNKNKKNASEAAAADSDIAAE